MVDVFCASGTCFCVVNITQQTFRKRCKIHLKSRYSEFLAHNKANQQRGEPDEDIAEKKRRAVKETTRR